MPELIAKPQTRRAFLQSAGAFAATLAFAQKPAAFAQAGADPEFHLAMLSDTHIPGDRVNGHRGFNPWENLRKIAPEVAAARPEAVLLNGDGARLEGTVEDYRELTSLLEPISAVAPVCFSLGNHDDRANFRAAMKPTAGQAQTVEGKLVTILEHAAVRLIVLDSLLYVNKTAGLLGKSQRAWLAEYLPKNADRPTVLCVHHTLADNDGDLLDAAQLFDIIRPHPHVKAIFFGHSHIWNISQRDRVMLVNLPAVGYNFNDKEPVGWVDARFNLTGVSLTLHAFAGNMAEHGKTTRVAWLKD